MAEEEHTAEAPHTAEVAQMTGMPPMLVYTIRGGLNRGETLLVRVGQGASAKAFWPQPATDDSYYIVILDANNPANKVKDFAFAGTNNHAVPGGLDQYLSNPGYIFALVTQSLSSFHVPQGDFYDLLAAHGAGRELRQLEQINTTLGCGSTILVSYALTGQCGPSPNVAYERGSVSSKVWILMSLMPLPNGQPPYSICDSNTFFTR
jgi:hypothetical protein